MASPPRYCPQLDGLRAVALAAVAWSQWEPDSQFGIPFGAGVHLFFVLSGFLITTILLAIRDLPSRAAGLRAFYLRRALRIVPAFYLALALAWAADVALFRETAAWHASFLTNLLVFVTQTWPGSMGHFWPLAVEAQFYAAWPWLIVFAPRRWLVPGVVAAVVAAPVFRWLLIANGHRADLLAVLTPGSLDSLGMGALLALAAQAPPGSVLGTVRDVPPPSTVRQIGAVAVAGWVGAIVIEAAGYRLSPPGQALEQTLQAIVFAWIVMRAAAGYRGIVGRVLEAAPLVYIGRISYGLYLAHGFAGDILGGFGLDSRAMAEPWRFVALASVSVALAAMSWHLLEQPLSGLKSRIPYGRAAPRPASATGPAPAR